MSEETRTMIGTALGIPIVADHTLPPGIAILVPPRRHLESDAELAKRSVVLRDIAHD